MSNSPRSKALGRTIFAATGVLALTAGLGLTAQSATAALPNAPAPLTNLAHLNFLLDTATPAPVSGHTTYDIAGEPSITMPWVYANAQPDGTFVRVGGGALDPATGHWGQGSYDADDISRAAVVYIRDWKQTHSADAENKAYELLRSTAYFQTTTGPNAGNVVLWMQPDGTLNPSATPIDLPNPSDSGASDWLGRTLWALGEGYAAFQHTDPKFASFLQQRIQLGIAALNRESLNTYGTFATVDGASVPTWLIFDGADASAEALLGLTAYTAANPSDRTTSTATIELAKGVADMASGTPTSWPYGAILPWTQSRSMWHAWASQMPAALAKASVLFGDRALLQPAITDSVSFTPSLLAASGPDNAWYPTPIDQTQIAYGADSRLQSLLAVAAVTHSEGIRQLAAVDAAWFFGANRSGKPIYNPANGVTFDGVQADGSVNTNGGAESTIHGLLSMLALDANPDVAKLAQSAATVSGRDGLTVTEAESAVSTTGTVVTPASAWTGESQYSGGAYLSLAKGQSATIVLPASTDARSIQPVVLEPSGAPVRSLWTDGTRSLGVLTSGVGAQGISAIPGALLPQTLRRSTTSGTVTVTALDGTLVLDAVIARPLVERLTLTGAAASTVLVHSASVATETTTVGAVGKRTTVSVYDSRGTRTSVRSITGIATITLRAGSFAIATT